MGEVKDREGEERRGATAPQPRPTFPRPPFSPPRRLSSVRIVAGDMRVPLMATGSPFSNSISM